VNPGVVRGGTRSNVVAAAAEIEVDVRAVTESDARQVRECLSTLQPLDPRCRISVEGGPNRPPMERSSKIVALFETARDVGREIGLELEESATGGGSDGNFTAALGVPTLDGLGAVGEGAHAVTESALLERIPERIAILAGLIARVSSEDMDSRFA
jgi:glutamate carboxypeptidase